MVEQNRTGRQLLPDDLEKDLLALMIACLMGCLLVSIVTRHWWPAWHEPVIKCAAGFLTWMVALGSSRAASLGLHVRVVFFADLLPPAVRRRMFVLADLFFLLFAAAIFVASTDMAHYSFTNPVPRGHPLVYTAMPVGMLLTGIRLCQRLYRARRRDA